MNVRYLIGICGLAGSLVGQPVDSGRFVIDRIESVVFGSQATDIITLSDTERLGFDGKYRTFDDIFMERLMFQDALKYRVMVDDKTIDSYISKIARNNSMSVDDITKMFVQAGYSLQEGRRQLGIMYGVNELLEYKIKSQLVVPEKDVVAYHEAHPLFKPASYVLEHAVVAVTSGRDKEVEKKIMQYIKTGKGMVVGWSVLPELAETEIADDKKFVTHLSIGQIASPVRIENGFELFRLKGKKAAYKVPLAERYREIAEQLRAPLFEKRLEEYKKELLTRSSYIRF